MTMFWISLFVIYSLGLIFVAMKWGRQIEQKAIAEAETLKKSAIDKAEKTAADIIGFAKKKL